MNVNVLLFKTKDISTVDILHKGVQVLHLCYLELCKFFNDISDLYEKL